MTVLYHYYICKAVLTSSFKNHFECEVILMSTKQYYCLRGRNKDKICSRMKLGGLLLICLAEKV